MIILYDTIRNLTDIYNMADPTKTTASRAPADQDEAVIEAPEVEPVAAATGAEEVDPALDPPTRGVPDDVDEVAVSDEL
jgi:hypothetical protein